EAGNWTHMTRRGSEDEPWRSWQTHRRRMRQMEVPGRAKLPVTYHHRNAHRTRHYLALWSVATPQFGPGCNVHSQPRKINRQSRPGNRKWPNECYHWWDFLKEAAAGPDESHSAHSVALQFAVCQSN